MPRIPLGDAGQAVAQPGPEVREDPNAFGASTGAALAQLGAQGQALAGNLIEHQAQLQQDVDRTTAAVAYQTHETNVKQVLQTAGAQLDSGQIDQIGYIAQVNDAKQQSFDSTIGALSDSHYKNVATIQSKGLDRATDLASQAALTKNSQQQIAANGGQVLDTAGKSIAIDPTTIDAVAPMAVRNYRSMMQMAGVSPAIVDKTAQDWLDSQYATHADHRAIMARDAGSLPQLDQLQHDLTAPDGYYAGKLDPGARDRVLSGIVSLRAQIQNQDASQQQARENQAVDAVNAGIDFNESGAYMSGDYKRQLLAVTAGTSQEHAAQELIHLNGPANAFASMSNSQRTATIQSMEADQANPAVGTDPVYQKQLNAFKATDARLRDGYKKDPWSTAASVGAIPQLPPIDTSSIPALVSSLSARTSLAPTVEALAGQKVSPLTPDETRRVWTVLDQLPAVQRGQEVSDIGRSIGDVDRIGALADQLKGERNVDRLALIAGANQFVSAGGPRIPSLIYLGAQYMHDKQAGIDDKVMEGVTSQAAAQLREAYPTAQAAQDAIDMTKYLYAYGAVKNNVSPLAVDSTQLAASISGATGGVVSHNGRQTLKPYGWGDDRFDAAVKGVDAFSLVTPVPDGKVQIGQTAIPVADFISKLPAAQIVRVAPAGVYAVKAGGGFAENTQKQPILIRLK